MKMQLPNTTLLVVTASLLMAVLSLAGGSALPRSERSAPIRNGSNQLITNGEYPGPSVVNNIVVQQDHSNDTPGPMGPSGPAGPQGPPGNSGGLTYTRWGRSDCSSTAGTVLVYEGIASGSLYNEGGGVDFLCLPRDPEFLASTAGRQQWRATLHGAEYEGYLPMPAYNSIHEHNVPCAVCYTPARGTKLMIPAKVNCPSSWTREYFGYLMSNAAPNQRNTFECMDVDAVPLPGSIQNSNGALFYFTETTCNGIPCGPYEDGKEIPCVVCTI